MQTKKEQTAPAPSNAFLQVLQTHEGGEVLTELTEAMRECVTAVALSGKPATFEFRVKFVPAAKGAFGVAFSKPKVKKAEPDRGASLWFGDEAGNLHRENPRQRELPLKTVTVADPLQAPAREVEDPLRREAKAVN